MYQIGKEYQIGISSEKYLFIKYHHQKLHPKKSWWIIDPDNEAQLFINMTRYSYISIDGLLGFNLKISGNNPDSIGTDINENQLVLAKFVFNNINWHGYPGNHKINKDRPTEEVYDKFQANGISLSIIRKIKKGSNI